MTPAKHDDLIYDVGMHQGEDTEFYLKKGFRVVAFEGDPDLARRCRERFAAELASGQLVIVDGAIVEDNVAGATVKFFRNLDTSVWGTVHPSWDARNKALGTRSVVIEVPAINFTDCLRRHGVPHYLKVDIEGADLVCLRALLPLATRPDYLSVESDKVSFDALVEEFRLLEELGYVEFQAVQQSTVTRRAPPLVAREGRHAPHAFAPGASGLFGRELPGRWLSRAEVLERYRTIFRWYRLVGDRSLLARSRPGRILVNMLGRVLGRKIPGWYDTHARLASAAK